MHHGIVIQNLSKSYSNGKAAVSNLSLDVRPGQVYCLLGHNGAGKSTTLKVLLGLLLPTSGKAWVGTHEVSSAPALARQAIAYLPESVSLYGDLSARENLEFFSRLGGQNHLERSDYYAILNQAGLPGGSEELRVSSFSKGMRQKLALAIAVSRKSKILILDEPMSGLDPATAEEIVQVIQRERNHGRAILMVTHDLNSVEQIADIAGFMREGKLAAEFSRQELEGRDLNQLYKSLQHSTVAA
ncbi:MAG: ABC transporter ATP-binding protein [Acidobacteriia bacterium]|nr:ABC transporter ATP-binding protein [Terriglobia bacterium]